MIKLIFCLMFTALPYLKYNSETEEAHLIVIRPLYSAFPAFFVFLLILINWYGMKWDSNDTALLALIYDVCYVITAMIVLLVLWAVNGHLSKQRSNIQTTDEAPASIPKPFMPDVNLTSVELWQQYDVQEEQAFWQEYEQVLAQLRQSNRHIVHYK